MTPAGLILAGGHGSRMGGAVPKPLTLLAGRPLIGHIVDRLGDTVKPLLIAAPTGQGFERFARPLAPDLRPGLPGPLAGIEAGLAALTTLKDAPRHLLVTPGDAPFLPRDLASQLTAAPDDQPIIAQFENRLQPATGLWPLGILPKLSAWLDADQPLAILAFLDSAGFVSVSIGPQDDAPDGDPFFNVNTPDDLATAQKFIGGTAAKGL
ncbi:NTP transferase domain-containing protein [Jiella sp. MQZ9-1]|uniref:Molybdenum cofactor guanylyltransferase n=1 Tax=Jiella flava TaxID=2816857 RepID=A0A939JVN1_9HYPH|nr:NTP transferase domain-containing protein [Jiella flava]MBO0661446.1 NTP transferase domain-containing protein [Jiella flava]MCD2470089.1 NTP transferase domain-containing protein [Jiella flava]